MNTTLVIKAPEMYSACVRFLNDVFWLNPPPDCLTTRCIVAACAFWTGEEERWVLLVCSVYDVLCRRKDRSGSLPWVRLARFVVENSDLLDESRSVGQMLSRAPEIVPSRA